MYQFVDTNEVPSTQSYLQDEAVNVNGVFLDDVVNGFITVSVSGRDSLSYDITSENNGSSGRGETYLGKRLESRYLTINFKLTASSASNLIAKYNSLKSYLSGDLVVKFADSMIWYYNGTLSGIANPPEGALVFVSSFDIYCADPVAHAVNPKGAYTATKGSDGRYSVTIVNEGNVEAPITVTATMNAENGYIGMYTDYGITEIGNKEEDDTEDYVSATTILNTSNFSEFTRYTGTNPENALKGNTGTAAVVNESGKNYFHLSNAGTNNNYWHGASYVYNFPSDETGHVGAKNVYCYFNAVFWAGLMGQTGQLQVLFADANNRLVMGYDIYKNDKKGNTGVWVALAGDGKGGVKTLANHTFTTSHLDNQNPFNQPRGHCDIYKNGANLRYYWFGSYPTFVVPELKDVEITKCYINLYQLEARSGNQLMRYFDFRKMTIRNDSAEYIRDYRNRFPDKSIVKMTGADSKIYVNGLPKLSEKIDGSNLFTIPPGQTTIFFQCSDWCDTPPTYQVEFTEANL
ncbi:phage tail family protein [Pseudolactococcus yaeyamensis]